MNLHLAAMDYIRAEHEYELEHGTLYELPEELFDFAQSREDRRADHAPADALAWLTPPRAHSHASQHPQAGTPTTVGPSLTHGEGPTEIFTQKD